MQRFFSGFPRGLPGVALLLMRTTIGAALLIQGAYYVREPNATAAAWAVGLVAMLAAGLLLIGFSTPFAGSAAVLGGLGIWLSLIPACTPTLFDSKASAVFALAILLGVVIVGPGAYSVDGRMFGRREIIFPRPVLGSEEPSRDPASANLHVQ